MLSVEGRVPRGQSFDLFDVEHGVTLEEVDVARDFDPAVGVGLVARDAVRIDDGRAFLAPADVGAKFDGLAVGHPDRCGEALHAGRSPQRQNVDAGVGLAVVTQRPRNAPGDVFGVPGPNPRPHSVFEGGDDLRGDAGVDVLLGRLIVLGVVVDGAGFHAGLLFRS